jgi:hypothetical protein
VGGSAAVLVDEVYTGGCRLRQSGPASLSFCRLPQPNGAAATILVDTIDVDGLERADLRRLLCPPACGPRPFRSMNSKLAAASSDCDQKELKHWVRFAKASRFSPLLPWRLSKAHAVFVDKLNARGLQSGSKRRFVRGSHGNFPLNSFHPANGGHAHL